MLCTMHSLAYIFHKDNQIPYGYNGEYNQPHVLSECIVKHFKLLL